DLIAGQAGGSMRDALSLLDQVISGITGPVTMDGILEILGVVDRTSVSHMAAAILKGDLDNILEIIGEVHAFGHSIPDFYSSVIHYFRDLLVIKMVTATDRLLDLPEKEIEAMRDVVHEIPSLHLTQILEMLFNAEKDIQWSSNPKMALEIAVIRMLQVTPLLPINDLIDKLDELRANLGTSIGDALPAAPPVQRPTMPGGTDKGKATQNHVANQTGDLPVANEDLEPAPEMSTDTATDRGETWKRLLDIISEKHPSIAPNLANSRMIGFSDGNLDVEVNGSSFNFKRIKRKDSMQILEDVCSTYLGRKVTLSIRTGNKKDSQEKAKKKTESERLKQEMLDHPLVAEAIQIFDGKIVDVKVDS
ncbi:MAG: hypothetical protein N2F24_16180, partial [Deltaproteobacteria bacterium]